jgi:hypothetical protein
MGTTWTAKPVSKTSRDQYARRMAAPNDPKVQARIRDEEKQGINSHFEVGMKSSRPGGK